MIQCDIRLFKIILNQIQPNKQKFYEVMSSRVYPVIFILPVSEQEKKNNQLHLLTIHFFQRAERSFFFPRFLVRSVWVLSTKLIDVGQELGWCSVPFLAGVWCCGLLTRKAIPVSQRHLWHFRTWVGQCSPQNWLSMSFPNFSFCDIMLVAWNEPWESIYTTEIGNPSKSGPPPTLTWRTHC